MKFVRCGNICIDVSNIVYARCDIYGELFIIEINVKTLGTTDEYTIDFKTEKIRNAAFDKLCEQLENYTV